MPNTYLKATTAANNAVTFEKRAGAPMSISAGGLASDPLETIKIEHRCGGEWEPLYKAGLQVQLDGDNNMLEINTAGLYRIDKEATAGPASFCVNTDSTIYGPEDPP